MFWKAKFWESAHPALNEWAADGSYDSGSFIADAAEGFVFDGGLHWLRPLRMFLGKAGKAVSQGMGELGVHELGLGCDF